MANHADVQAAFGGSLTLTDGPSLSPWSDVWAATVGGGPAPVAAIVKQTWGSPAPLEAWQRALVDAGIRTVAPLVSAVTVGDGDDAEQWVAYPHLEGRAWDGSAADLAAAGRLLAAMHAASEHLSIEEFPEFEWGSDDRDSIDEDIDAIRASAAEHWPNADASRWIGQLDTFGETLQRMRDAGLPEIPASLDHRASNLVFDAEGAQMVDLENASLAPRVFDLAVAVLLFPLEHPGAKGRALDAEQWAAFRDAYLDVLPLTEAERALWPTALTYMKLEWGTWHLTEGVEAEPEGNLDYLEDLLTLDEHTRFPLA